MQMTQIYVEFTKLAAMASIHNTETYFIILQAWFINNSLALNSNKKDVIQMSTTW